MDHDRGSSIPLTEYDDAPTAFIEPAFDVAPRLGSLEVPEACVVTFFGDAVERLVADGRAEVLLENRWEDGPHPLYALDHARGRVAMLRCGVGAPLAAGLLEQAIAAGCRYFVVCGGAGALSAELTLGHVVVVQRALRDEGTSFHYLPPSRYIEADDDARRVLEEVLAARDVPFVTAPTWTTDAPYRETVAKVAARREEGCVTVEMEAAALAAVARFRGVSLTQLVYCGDDLSGTSWDHRSWQSLADVRASLVDVAADAALALADTGDRSG